METQLATAKRQHAALKAELAAPRASWPKRAAAAGAVVAAGFALWIGHAAWYDDSCPWLLE